MQQLISWLAGFPGLIWSVELPFFRLRILKEWSVAGIDMPRLIKDARYRKKLIFRQDYPLLLEFIDMVGARMPAAVIFRLTHGEHIHLLLQGWPSRDESRYDGFLKQTFLPATYSAGDLSVTCQLSLGENAYPVFVMDMASRRIIAENREARELFGAAHAARAPLSLARIAPGEHGAALLKACEKAMTDDIWAGTLAFSNARRILFKAKVRLTPCGPASQNCAIRVALLNIPANGNGNKKGTAADSPAQMKAQLPLKEGLAALYARYSADIDGLMFSDILSAEGRVVVYGTGPAFQELPWGSSHPYEGTIAQEIERYGLHSMTVEETLDSIKSIDWVLFAPHGVHSYFAKPFYSDQGLHAVLIVASRQPEHFGSDAEERFSSLFGPFEQLVLAWRQTRR